MRRRLQGERRDFGILCIPTSQIHRQLQVAGAANGHNDVLSLDDCRGGEDGGIIQVTKENFPLFAEFHSQYDFDMYWNSERLAQSLEQWMIFLCEKEHALRGAVYCTKGEPAEIFGVDYAGGVYSPEIFCALTGAVINACKARQTRHLIFFTAKRVRLMHWPAGFAVWESIFSWSKDRGTSRSRFRRLRRIKQ